MNTNNYPAVVLNRTKQPQSLLLQPAASVNDIVTAWHNYQDLKAKLLVENDYQMVQGKNYIKKSGWRKIQTAFSISDELISEERKDYKDYFVYEVTVKASAPNGRFAFGLGSCGSNERRFAHAEHDVRSTAHTRAKNRAISDLVGGGDVSAEEIVAEEREVEQEVVETNEDILTTRQRDLLVNLLYQKIADVSERSAKMEMIGSLTKQDASDYISELLQK